MSGDSEILRIMEIVLTAEIFNHNPALDINDLTPPCREIFGAISGAEVKRPVYVSDGLIKRSLSIADAHQKMKENPFISYEEFGQRLKITALEPAAQWFLKQGGKPFIEKNPTLAFFFENIDSAGVTYKEVRSRKPPVRGHQRPTSMPAFPNSSGRMRNSAEPWTLSSSMHLKRSSSISGILSARPSNWR